MNFSIDAKFRAARAILNETREGIANKCHVSGALIQRIENNLGNVSPQNYKLLENFFNEKGIFFGEESIEVAKECKLQDEEVTYKKVPNSVILEHLKTDKNFEHCTKQWNDATKDNLCSVIRSFNFMGMDVWSVDMGGEIRFGAKEINDKKGKPLVYIQYKKNGFTVDYNRKVGKYSEFISQLPSVYGHGILIEDDYVKNLHNLSIKGVALPPVIKASCASHLPGDYLN